MEEVHDVDHVHDSDASIGVVENEMIDVSVNSPGEFPNETLFEDDQEGDEAGDANLASSSYRRGSYQLPQEDTAVRNVLRHCDLGSLRDFYCALLPLACFILIFAVAITKVATHDYYTTSSGEITLTLSDPVMQKTWYEGMTISGDPPESVTRRVTVGEGCYYMNGIATFIGGTIVRADCRSDGLYVKGYAFRDGNDGIKNCKYGGEEEGAFSVSYSEMKKSAQMDFVSSYHRKATVEGDCSFEYPYAKATYAVTLLKVVLASFGLVLCLLVMFMFGSRSAIVIYFAVFGIILHFILALKNYHVHQEGGYPFFAAVLLSVIFLVNNCREIPFAGVLFSMAGRVLAKSFGVFVLVFVLNALLWFFATLTAVTLGSVEGFSYQFFPIMSFLYLASFLCSLSMYVGAGLGSMWFYSESKSHKKRGVWLTTLGLVASALSTNLGSLAFAAVVGPVVVPLLVIYIELNPNKQRNVVAQRIFDIFNYSVESVVDAFTVFAFVGMAKSGRPFLNASKEATLLIKKNLPGWKAVMRQSLYYPLLFSLYYIIGMVGGHTAFASAGGENDLQYRWMYGGFVLGVASAALSLSAVWGCALSILLGYWRLRSLGIKWQQSDVPKGTLLAPYIEYHYSGAKNEAQEES